MPTIEKQYDTPPDLGYNEVDSVQVNYSEGFIKILIYADTNRSLVEIKKTGSNN